MTSQTDRRNEHRSFSERLSRVGARIAAAFSRLPREDGQTLVEYALIGTLILVAVVVALGLLAPPINAMFSSMTNAF